MTKDAGRTLFRRGHVWAGTLLLLVALLLGVGGCNRDAAAPVEQTASASAAAAEESLPNNNASDVVKPDEGGIVRLSDGTEVALPPQAVSETAVATLRAISDPPDAALPRSNVGRAYEFTLEGGTLAGVAIIRLPLPANANADEYELAAYRWNGQTWERITGRLSGQVIQFGTTTPGLFAIQGQWREADASLSVEAPALQPGQQSLLVSVGGVYRYNTLPTLQHDFVPAHLELKRDSSGGAGQVTGMAALDNTVAETVLWFKPNPENPLGLIEFSHVFEVAPGQLDVPPGTASRFYVLLTVEDSAAPTRRASTGVEFTQTLPIQIVGIEVVRPLRANEEAQPLRWRVELNDQGLFEQPATELALSLSDVLSRGGVGRYRITLEAQFDGEWISASNPVNVELQLPSTSTPMPSATPTSSPTLSPTPGPPPAEVPGMPTMPATPTRRTPPDQRPDAPTQVPLATAEAATTGTPTPTPTRPSWASVFWADRYRIAPGECTTLHWNVENVTEVYFEEQGTTGNENREVCPKTTTAYTLRTVNSEGSQTRSVTITVVEEGPVSLVFFAESYEISKGKCTVLHWQATDVAAVYLNGIGVAGEASEQVCPESTTIYKLQVIDRDGDSTTHERTIIVTEEDAIVIRFWAERYALEENHCTTLHWFVQDVTEVHLTTQSREGVSGTGSREVCPSGNKFYLLEAAAGDQKASKTINLTTGRPDLDSSEIIAQGLVNTMTRVTDIDPGLDGEQPGWDILGDGLNVLFAGTEGWGNTVATIRFAESLAFSSAPQVDWPLNPGQLMEFRRDLQRKSVHPRARQSTVCESTIKLTDCETKVEVEA